MKETDITLLFHLEGVDAHFVLCMYHRQMGGTATSFEERGIVPRAMSYMFRKVRFVA